jgi:DNA repair exonuclease SbcCD ATPase subunit
LQSLLYRLLQKVADLREQLRERRESGDQLMMENYELETKIKSLHKELIELKTTKTKLQLTLDEKLSKEKQLLEVGTQFDS